MSLSRRDWLGAILGVQDSTPRAGGGQVGELFDPRVAGRSRDRTAGADNDKIIQGIEQKLRCTCGCTLDVFTCRTTDFTCTYSPAMHREVVALYSGGRSEAEIIAAFVTKYGEEVLMAPEPQGFNLAGYLVPGAAILAVGALVLWVIRRRLTRRATMPAMPAEAGGPPVVDASPEELARLERELEKLG